MNTYSILLLSLALVALLTIVAIYRKKTKPSLNTRQAYEDGLRSLIDDDYQNAFIKLKQAVNEDVENIDAYLKLGDLFRKRGMLDKALQIHNELMLRQNLSIEFEGEVQKSLSLDYMASGHNEKAIDILQKLFKDPVQKNWASLRLLELYIKSKKWAEAANIFNGYSKRDSLRDSIKLANLKILMGRDLQETGEYHKSRLLFKEGISINDSSPLPYLFIAESYIEENRLEDAFDFLKKLSQKMPQYAHLGFPMLEDTLFQLGRFGEIESLYRGVLEQDPGNSRAKVALAKILIKKNDLHLAENLLKSALDKDPADPLAAIHLAEIYTTQRRPKEAIDTLTAITEKIGSKSENLKCQICGITTSKLTAVCSNCGNLGTYF